MLQDVFVKDKITILENVNDWKEAIHVCLEPLIRDGSVSEQYSEAVIRNVERYGSNFMISPYIVLPHARPEQGVIKNSVSLLLLKKSVYFKDSKMPIKLVIIMAATDSKSHLQILKAISNSLSDEKRMNAIMNSSRTEELYFNIMQGLKNVR